MIDSSTFKKKEWIGSILFKEVNFSIFLLYIIVWFTQLSERWATRTGGIRIEAILAGFLIIILVFTLSSSRKAQQDKAGFTPYVILYLLVLLIQVVNSWDSRISWFFFTERVLKYSLVGLFISHFTRSTEKLKLVIFAFLLACFKITQEGVWGGITGNLVWQNQGIMRLHGSTGMYEHPNSLSQLALGTLPFIYYLFPFIKARWLKIGSFLLMLFSMYCIIYTGSRTGYLGLICMFFIIFKKVSKENKKRLILTCLIVLPLLINYLPEEYKGRFVSTFSGQEAAGRSKEGRIRMYGEAWTIFTKHPFGVGVGNYILANDKYYNYRQEVHCLYLEVLTHIGIHGFIIFMFLIAKIFSSFYRLDQNLKQFIDKVKDQKKHLRLTNDLLFLQAVLYSTYVYFIIRLFVDIFGMDLYGICWWLVIGIVSALTFIINSLQKDWNNQLQTESVIDLKG